MFAAPRYEFSNSRQQLELENSVYGLHKLIVTEVVAGQDTNFKVVKIDDSIGMKSVEHIIDLLGMSIKCEFLIGKDRMEKIHLDLGGGCVGS